ncbi:MAG: DNA cytosine methyltransferase [Gemmatimonadota bacterium]
MNLAVNFERGLAPHGSMEGDEVAPTLSESEAKGQTLTYWDGGQLSDTLDVSMLVKGQMMPEKRRMPVVVFKPSHYTRGKDGAPSEISPPLSADADRGDQEPVVLVHRARRFTPLECERLQGFPDNWTAVGGMKDTPRYRFMGNAVTVTVAEWLGRRIMEIEAGLG